MAQNLLKSLNSSNLEQLAMKRFRVRIGVRLLSNN